MFFDLSREISLDKKNLALYGKLRITLYALSFLLAGYLAFKILFPSLFFEFSFNNPNARTNNITNPRIEDLLPVQKGALAAGKTFNFDASLTGTYSSAIVSFSLDDKSEPMASQRLSVKKSYNAFLYPEGDAMGFKNGTLLWNKNDSYIVSGGQLRKFSNEKVADALGFPKDGFVPVEDDELGYNAKGEDITDAASYPDGSIFHISDNYYLLSNGQLLKFLSDSAFLTRYKERQAIEKDAGFLGKYPLSEEMVGFSDGSFLSYADAIDVINDGKLFPIDSPETFLGKDFDWNDVKRASADEVAFYKKQKLFTIANDHPNGTIFTAIEDGRRYLIQNGQKHLLPSDNVFASWKNTSPIPVSQESLKVSDSCQLKKSFLHSGTYSCEIPIVDMQSLIGSDYVFSLEPENKIILDTINVEFKKNVGLANLKFTLSEILSRVKNNYAR
jgi:hypothetical protein